MATEILTITEATIVRVELKDDKGATLRYQDFQWPAEGGQLLLNDGPNGAVAHAQLPNGMHGFARFPGKVTGASLAISAVPMNPGATDPTKAVSLEITSYSA